MKNNSKKGFSLAEIMVIFLLISITLVAFAPVMTKQSKKKKIDPNCPGGTKRMVAEYTTPGEHTFVAPENITGTATITLVGAGGKGGNGDAKTFIIGDEEVVFFKTGGGGGGGYYDKYTAMLAPNTTYNINLGAGGGKDEYQIDTTTNILDINNESHIATRGGDGQNGTVGVFDACKGELFGTGGQDYGGNGCDSNTNRRGVCLCEKGGVGGKNLAFITNNNIVDLNVDLGSAGKEGDVCLSINGNCNIHGKQGSGYEQNANSSTGFIAGIGGGGGGADITLHSAKGGLGGLGGDGYARIDYEVRCE